MSRPTSNAIPSPEEPHIDGRVLRARALREERRAQILDATRRVFADKGYHAGSINDIIDAAGIARGTFYLHFESKRAVLEELLDQFLDQLQGMVRRVDISSPVPAEVQLLDNVTRVISTFVANDDLTRILLREAVGLDEEFDQKLKHFYARVLDLAQRSIRTGMALGLVRPVDAHLAACCVLGGVKEVIVQRLLEAEAPAPDAAELARAVLDLTLHGLLVPSRLP